MINRALFLDRDGTINVYGEYLYKIEQIQFIDGIFDLIKKFNNEGWYVFVVSNQAGVARGLYNEKDVIKLHQQMQEIFVKNNARIDKWYYCPHHDTFGLGKYKVKCECRKPNIGMIKKAQEEYAIDIEKSYLIGDNITDIQCAQNAGMAYYRANGSAYRADEIFEYAAKGVCKE